MSERPLLLHSVAEFGSILWPLLDELAPRRIVEIGGEGGALTVGLARWGAEHDAEVHCIEPFPNRVIDELADRGEIRLTVGKSPGALHELPPADLYVVDGDHNFHVVREELATIFGREGEPPVAILHDVAWPAARRDQYYDPADVPEEARHAYDYDAGAVPGEARLAPTGGFRGEGAFAYAIEEGGERNGVLTAVEDFLAGREDLRFLRVPAIFGLGAVFPAEGPRAAAVERHFGPLHEHDLLARLEENRLRLLTSVIAVQDEQERRKRGQNALVAGLQAEVDRLSAENATLRLELARAAGRPVAS